MTPSTRLFFLLATLAGLGYAPAAAAATCTTSTTNGSWNTAGNWSCGHVPLAADDVVVNRNFNVNVTTAAVQSVTITAGTLSQGSTLNTAAAPAGALVISGGTLTSNANMTIGGTTTISSGTFNPSSNSTRIFTGLVTISGGTWAGTSRNATLRGGLTVSSGTFTAGSGTYTFNTNNQDITGTVSIPRMTVTGVTVTNNGILTVATALAGTGELANANGSELHLNFTGAVGITTLTASTATNLVDYGFAGTQTIKATTYSNLTLSSSGAKTAAGNMTVNGDLTMTGSATFNGGTSRTHDFLGDWIVNTTAGTPFAFTTTSIINFNTPSPTPFATTVGGTTAATLAFNDVNINNTSGVIFNDNARFSTGTSPMLTVSSTLTPAAGVIISGTGTLTGTGTVQVTRTAATADFSSQYTIANQTLTNLTVEYIGAAAQTVSAVAYGGLKINNVNGVALPGSDVTVSTLLTLAGGIVDTGANTLMTSADCPGSVSRTAGHVAGFLMLHIPAGSPSCAFDVGDSTTYRPINLTFAPGTTAGDLTGSVSQSATEHPNIAASDLEPTEDVNRYWTLTNSGVGLSAGGYDATFNFVAGDVDVGADTANFEVRRWNSPTWFTTITGTRTGASTSATGILGFSDFAIGKKRIRSFTITLNNSPDTCTAASVTITAKDKFGNTVNNYTGTINISTAPGDGDWAVASGGGTLNNGTADDGLATYAFVGGDSGVVTLTLSNVNEDKNLTVTVVDNATASTSSNSSAIQYRGNFFQIANDTLQIAGKPQTMTVTLKRGASCSGSTVTTYPNGNHALKAWYTTDADHPAGATAPAITGASPAITTSVPGANNLTLNFTSGAASFTLTTTDVGKYTVSLRDDSTSFSPGTLDGPSPTITTRPFGLAFRGANSATAIQHSTTAGSAVLAKAGANFTVTVAAYLWDAADDANGDGIPDAGADITNNGLAPRFAWPVTITAGATLPSPGTTGTLTRGGTSPVTIIQATFSGGAATINDLQYSEVGSVTLEAATSTDYLNTSGVTVGGSTNGHSGLDGTGTAGGYVGRFYPNHFALTTAGTLTQACSSGGFSYLGQNLSFAGIKFEARNVANVKTNNYDATTGYARLTSTTFSAYGFGARDTGGGGTNLTSRIDTGGTTSGSWAAGELALTVSALSIGRAVSPDGPFAATSIGIAPTDSDGVTMQTSDFNMDVDAAGGNDHAQIGGGTTHWRFGRLRLQNANGSQLISMPIPIQAQYWNGNGFVTNTLDGCTSIGAGNIAIGNAQNSLTAAMVTPPVVGGTFVAGIGSLRLPKPSSAVRGSVDVSVNLTGGGAGASCTAGMPASTGSGLTWLQGAWCGATYDKDPTARATFGTFRNTDQFIYQQENY